MNDDWKRAMTSLIIRALRPILLPLILEALEHHTQANTPTGVYLYTNGPNTTMRRSPMQGSP